MTDRREFLAGLAGVSVAAGAVVAAAASPDPDADLERLVTEWLAARKEHLAAREAVDEAEKRAKARYPDKVPAWQTWVRRNHPSGEFDPFGDRAVLTRPALAAVDDHLYRAAGTVDDPEHVRLREAVFAAGRADAENYYAEIRPAYDRLQAERKAAIEAIDEAEGVPAVKEARSAAWDRADAAHYDLTNYRPLTLEGFAVKALALLRSPFDPQSYKEDNCEVDSLIADAEALIGGGAA